MKARASDNRGKTFKLILQARFRKLLTVSCKQLKPDFPSLIYSRKYITICLFFIFHIYFLSTISIFYDTCLFFNNFLSYRVRSFVHKCGSALPSDHGAFFLVSFFWYPFSGIPLILLNIPFFSFFLFTPVKIFFIHFFQNFLPLFFFKRVISYKS